MHEMSLCESLVQIIEEQAEREKFERVKTVFLEIGIFAGVEIDALTFCFDIVCQGSVADSAKLVITRLPSKAWCSDCKKEINMTERMAPCPKCKGYNLQYLGGDEIRIKELEVY